MPDMGHHRIDDFGEDIYSFPYVSHMIYYSAQDTNIVVLAVLHKAEYQQNIWDNVCSPPP